jgi:hypothetical protein
VGVVLAVDVIVLKNAGMDQKVLLTVLVMDMVVGRGWDDSGCDGSNNGTSPGSGDGGG